MSPYRPTVGHLRLMSEQSPLVARLIVLVACSEEQSLQLRAVTDDHSLTRGTEYGIAFWGNSGELFYTDDQCVPVILRHDSVLKERFELPEGLTDVPLTELVAQSSSSRLWYGPMVRQNILTANRLVAETRRYQVGDILKGNQGQSTDGSGVDSIYVVVRLLTPSESRMVSTLTRSMARVDLMCLRVDGDDGLNFMTANSWQFSKIGSLEEWGLPALDPAVIETMTIFD